MRAMTYRLMSIVVIASMALTSAARAEQRDGFLELVAGPTLVQGDEDYENVVDDSFKLGLRGGVMGTRSGFEIALDWNDLDPPDVEIPFLGTYDNEVHRFRFMLGGRFGALVAGKVFVFGRLAAGVDYLSASTEGPGVDEDRSDVGFGFELGGGAIVRLGSLYLGGQLAIPFAFHSEDDDAEEGDLNLDYRSTEIDLLLNVGLAF
jgi:hypothetical protein